MTDQSLGTPVFDAKGRLLGVTVYNFANGRRSQVVLPAGDIAEIAKQAAAMQLEAKTPEAPIDPVKLDVPAAATPAP